jgi:hypothetical protein
MRFSFCGRQTTLIKRWRCDCQCELDSTFVLCALLDIKQIWCPSTLQRLFSIYSKYDVGDVFCVAYSVELQTVYLGAQNTSIQVEFPALQERSN